MTYISPDFSKPEIREATWEFHKQAAIVDLHVHSLFAARHFGRSLIKRHRSPRFWNPFQGHLDMPRAIDAGVAGLGLAIYPLHHLLRDDGYFRGVKREIAVVEEVCQAHPYLICQARSVADVRQAKGQGRVAVFLALEGAHGIDGDLDNLTYLAEKGVRYLTLTHWLCNGYANAVSDPDPPFCGLSKKGRELIVEMNRLGIAIDTSHLSEEAFWEVAKINRQPLLASHTGFRQFNPAPRHLTEDQIKAIVDSNGLVGVMLFPPALRQRGLGGHVSWVVENLLFALEKAGPKHVALGSNFDNFLWLPKPLKDVTDLPILTQALMDAGVSGDALRAFYGENVLEFLWRSG